MVLLLSLWILVINMHQAVSQCPWIKIGEPANAAPYPIGMCVYNTPYFSTSLYCEENFNETGALRVVEYAYEGRDCVESSLIGIRDVYECEDDDSDCHCEGSVDECTILRNRAYLVNDNYDNPGCNESYYHEYVHVYDICRDLGVSGGSVYYDCGGSGENYGVELLSYDGLGCTGVETSTPTDSDPCQLTTCTGDAIAGSASKTFTNAAIVTATILLFAGLEW
eukprot:CAMPEP_0202694552 /NCGR_PEP_ID=MMETSP1385-20130828/8387_1 /ASSEMBLY_ACC=CAM_ASM_000861 /TAXON_ID=933848 /ORGANISM="Elphidium margaritaceum" /LENGTH=222 /DNA_ID=CAMNT_0049350421 /DNA_START=55 /DNA_END=723 /DNA_ORIENTATION=-